MTGELGPRVERLLVESDERQPARLSGRERATELAVAAGFLIAALAAAALLPYDGRVEPGLAAGLVGVYALAARVEFHVGASWTVPTQLVLVPMLFLVPLPAVPLLVALALVVARLPEHLRGEVHPERAVVGLGVATYSLGPVIVLALAGVGAPQWSDWPVYLAALGAQIGLDAAVSTLACWVAFGVPVRKQLGELSAVYAVDALLAPIGLLIAFAAYQDSFAFLAALPLLGLIAIFARERQARIASALTLSDAYRGTAVLLSELLTDSDEYTGGHSRSVVALAHQVGTRLELSEWEMRELEFGALLHDVGKMSVPKSILNKPGSLTHEEFEVMKGHVVKGEAMLKRVGGVLADAGHVVRTHHERYDGRGYPDGISGDEIPIAARVISCCDAFSAMTTDRPYRSAMPLDTAIGELRKHSGTQFDPQVVDSLVTLIDGDNCEGGDSATGEPQRDPEPHSLALAL